MTAAEQIDEQGFAIIAGVLSKSAVRQLAMAIEAALAPVQDNAVALRNRGGLYGARNVLELCPAAANAWRTAPLIAILTTVLGEQFGLVRGLFFNKPPEKSWSLPWHQDLTIAVAEHRAPDSVFRKPTTKAGVPHVEAPAEILARMLTLRIHLDDVDDDNGPLRVLPGTHLAIHDAAPPIEPVAIHATAGDVLAMRTLLFHASSASTPGTTRHRRILHLEFAADRELPDGYVWRQFDR